MLFSVACFNLDKKNIFSSTPDSNTQYTNIFEHLHEDISKEKNFGDDMKLHLIYIITIIFSYEKLQIINPCLKYTSFEMCES